MNDEPPHLLNLIRLLFAPIRLALPAGPVEPLEAHGIEYAWLCYGHSIYKPVCCGTEREVRHYGWYFQGKQGHSSD